MKPPIWGLTARLRKNRKAPSGRKRPRRNRQLAMTAREMANTAGCPSTSKMPAVSTKKETMIVASQRWGGGQMDKMSPGAIANRHPFRRNQTSRAAGKPSSANGDSTRKVEGG